MKKPKKDFPSLPMKFNFKTVYYDIYSISIRDDNFEVEGVGEKFGNFEKAYDYVERQLGGLPKFNSRIISNFSPKYNYLSKGMIVNSETNRLFMSRGQKNLYDLNQQYKYFQRLAKSYLKDTKNFYMAYNFLTHHPVFWSLRGDLSNSKILFWDTDYGFNEMWHTVYLDKNGITLHLLEHGPYMDSEEEIDGIKNIIPCRIASHDIRLDVVGKTYEEAVIKLAKRVHKFYNLNGEER